MIIWIRHRIGDGDIHVGANGVTGAAMIGPRLPELVGKIDAWHGSLPLFILPISHCALISPTRHRYKSQAIRHPPDSADFGGQISLLTGSGNDKIVFVASGR